MKAKKPRIIIWDVETAPMLVETFTLYPERIDHSAIVEDGFLICAAWKELGEKTVHAVQITKPHEDKKAIQILRDALSQADLIIGHNSDRFDLKKLNARLIYHKLPPLPQIPSVDTLKEVRKIAEFPSKRLDYLAQTLIGSGKLPTEKGLWSKARLGNKKAIADMVKYNKVDVIRTEEVYTHLRPYIKSHPHLGVLRGHDRDVSCNKCESTSLQKRGTYVTAAGLLKQRVVCNKCGSWQNFPAK